MSNKTDILICSLPTLFLDRVPGAPALIKSACKEAGFTAQTIDLSLDFYINESARNLDQFNKLSTVFRPSEEPSESAIAAKDKWLKRAIGYIKDSNCPVVGLSVFTFFQHRAAYFLAKEIRKQLPNVKILVGGLGLNINCTSLSNLIKINRLDILNPFHVFLKINKLVDHVILGVDGLDDIIKYLELELGVNAINGVIKEEISLKKNQYASPVPDYDDYLINEYMWPDGKSLPVTGSKGCVRACTFCDVPGQFGRFRMRTGVDIGNEIVQLATRHGIRKFEFTDSLVNGSLKVFKEWMEVVADYNNQQPIENRISWFGQYICRPQSQIPEDLYSLMSQSGVVNLVIGVESGSNAILKDMKKKMTVEDVFDELDMFEKYNIKAHFLMFSGFYTETRDRFIETLEFLIKCQRYVAIGIVAKFSIGAPLYINNDTYLHDHAEDLGLVIDPFNDFNWTSKEDPSNDLIQRTYNRLIQQELMDVLGYHASSQHVSTMYQLDVMLSQIEKELEERLNEYAKT